MSERARLAWRCRRGTRELDILLERFLARGYDQLSEPDKAHFERLLDLEDDQLQSYFFSDKRPTDGDLSRLITRIRDTR